MKKVIFMLMFVLCVNVGVHAQDVTYIDANNIYSIIVGEAIEDYELACKNPQQLTRYEFIANLINIYEIRMGKIETASLGGYFSDYENMTEEEKTYIDKAVMLGIVPKGTAFNKDFVIDYDEAYNYSLSVVDTIDFITKTKPQDMITSFIVNNRFVNKVNSGEKVNFYFSLNSTPDFNKCCVLMVLYEKDKLIDIKSDYFDNLRENEFTVMNVKLDIPENDGEYKLKVFLLDDINSIKPLCDYTFIQ